MRIVAKSVLLLVTLSAAAWAADSGPAPRMQVVYEAVLRNGFTVQHDHQQKIGDVTRLFLSAAPDSGFVDVPTDEIVSVERQEVPLPAASAAASAVAAPVSPRELDRLVHSASDQHLVDPDLIRSVIKAESNFNVHAVSPKGAQGLMQLMPQTASQLGVKDAFVPQDNIDGGTRYLRDLLVLYNNDMAKALAAYNAGPQRVAQYKGVPPYRETHAYVARVIKDFNRSKREQRAAATKNQEATPPTTSNSKPPASGNGTRTGSAAAKRPRPISAKSASPGTASEAASAR